MNTIKGFRFHPTDEELIEFLQLKTSNRDSLVQFIDEVPDICQSEPYQLAERSSLQTGDRLWYFIYSPKYKYRNSKRINRTTGEGYWKPTGVARKIIDPETGEVIGTKKTLVFHKGQCKDKTKIKTCWVMHEYELIKASPNSIGTNQKTFNLCKLKKKGVDISCTDARRSSHHNNSDDVCNQSGCTGSYAGERSNQHSAVNEDAASNLSSCFVNQVAEDAISKETLHLTEVPKECEGPEYNNGVQKLYSITEKDDESCGLILNTNGVETVTIERSNQHNVIGDETVTIERSNEHNVIVAAEGSGVPSSFEDLATDDILFPLGSFFDGPSSFEDLAADENLFPTGFFYDGPSSFEDPAADNNLFPMDFSYDGWFSCDELLEESEATNNSNWIQNQSISNSADDEFLNSLIVDNNEANLQEENILQSLAAENEFSGLPSIGGIESSESVEKPRKRPRLLHDDHVGTAEAQVSITNQQ